MLTYLVQRHGGKTNHHWRDLFETEDILVAKFFYRGAAKRIRQGGVRLVERMGNGQDSLVQSDVYG